MNNDILRVRQLADFSKQINTNNRNACQFECLSCGLYPTEAITENDGQYISYCQGCEDVERYECQLVYKSRGAHDCK